MTYFQSIILGIIQGMTEFLPISSSGHLIIVPKFFDWADQGLAFDAIIHLATALVIILVLRMEIWQILKGFNLSKVESEYRQKRKMMGLIILAIIPAGLIGWLFNDMIEQKFRIVEVVAWSLIFWGIVLGWAEYYSSKLKDTTVLNKIGWRQAIIVGLMQLIALIPGTSRSGITITAGLFSGMTKSAAVKFSFLAGLPLIIGAGSYKLIQLFKLGIPADRLGVLIAGFIAAFISGLFAIKLLLWLAEKGGFKVFVIYRILLGLGLLLMF